MIYLDNAATTFPKPERVYTALETANRELSFNAGRGSYKAARAASAIIDDTKNRLLSLFHATGYADIVFTPSVTHALNQVLNGLDLTGNSVIYVSPYAEAVYAMADRQLKKKQSGVFEQLNEIIAENFDKMFNDGEKYAKLEDDYRIHVYYHSVGGSMDYEEQNLSNGEAASSICMRCWLCALEPLMMNMVTSGSITFLHC